MPWSVNYAFNVYCIKYQINMSSCHKNVKLTTTIHFFKNSNILNLYESSTTVTNIANKKTYNQNIYKTKRTMNLLEKKVRVIK